MLEFECRFVRFSNIPVIPQTMVVDSKMNKDITPNANFDGPSVRNPENPSKELEYDNDGNPVFVNGGLPPIEDNTPPSVIPSIDSSQRNLDNRMPQNNDLDFE
jgi:hypothetical protein